MPKEAVYGERVSEIMRDAVRMYNLTLQLINTLETLRNSRSRIKPRLYSPALTLRESYLCDQGAAQCWATVAAKKKKKFSKVARRDENKGLKKTKQNTAKTKLTLEKLQSWS